MERPAPLSRRELLVLIGIVLLALGLRLGYVLSQRGDILFDHPILDEQRYVDAARALEAGRHAEKEAWWQPPGILYALMVVFRLVGSGLLFPRLLQVVLSAAACLLVFAIGRRGFGNRVGLAAAAILAVHGVVVFESHELLPPTWILFADLAALLLLLRAKDQQTLQPSFVAGLALGVSTVFSPTVLPFVAVAAGWLRRAPLVAVLLAGVVLPLVPVTAHNYQRGHELVLVSTNGGLNFFIGNNERYQETFALRPGRHWEELTTEPRRKGIEKAGAASTYFVRKGLRFYADQPARALGNLARKGYLFWNGREIPRDTDLQAARAESTLLRVLVGPRSVPWPDGLLLPLAVMGLILCWPERRRLFPLYGFLAVQAVVIPVFFVSSRHRVPALPILALFAAAGVVALATRWRELGRRKQIGCVAGLAALLVLLNLPTWEAAIAYHGERDFYRGIALRDQQQRPVAALAAFRRAVAEGPRDARFWFELGNTLSATGSTREAARAWSLAGDLDPWDSRHRRRAAEALGKLGDVDGALAVLQAHLDARQRDPAHYAPDHLNLAFVRATRGQYREAAAHVQAAARADPAHARRQLPGMIQAALRTPSITDAAFWITVGDVLRDLGLHSASHAAWQRALALASDPAQRGALEQRLGR
jgi:tetratricopeptide (TPR) repeat protein